MSIKPILFNTEMVRAVRDDRKTVTRRVVKPQPRWSMAKAEGRFEFFGYVAGNGPGPYLYTPSCQPGDILWVRETWAHLSELLDERAGYVYQADLPQCDLDELKRKKFRWRPSIHMPREAARIFLRVTDVRVERLMSITPEQLRAEGFPIAATPAECENMADRLRAVLYCDAVRIKFTALWDSTIRPGIRTLYGWGGNPWVWVIEFERCEMPEEWSAGLVQGKRTGGDHSQHRRKKQTLTVK